MNMNTLCFATSNKEKLKEARRILGVEIVGTHLKIDEIQSLDPIEVATKKAKAYFDVLKKPIFVEDISLSIKTLSGLPGTYIDAFMKTLSNEGIIYLMKGKKQRDVVAQATLVFVNRKGNPEIFIGRLKGEIANYPRGGGFGWDPIFIPEGQSMTLAQMGPEKKNEISMRAIALNKFKNWLQNAKI